MIIDSKVIFILTWYLKILSLTHLLMPSFTSYIHLTSRHRRTLMSGRSQIPHATSDRDKLHTHVPRGTGATQMDERQ